MHRRHDLKQQIPKVQSNTPHTEVGEYAEGSERGIKVDEEGLPWKKEV